MRIFDRHVAADQRQGEIAHDLGATTLIATNASESSPAVRIFAYGVVVFGLSALRSVRRAGIAVVIGNLLYTVAAVAIVVADVFPLTTTGVVLTLGGGVYTAIFAELQYQGWRRAKA